MKRNWNAIHEISCRPTKIALATCSDQAVLPRLQQAFPECFEEGEETVIGPWSEIQQKWAAHAAKHYGPNTARKYLHTAWGEAVEIPYCLFFGRFSQNDTYHADGPIPITLLDELEKITGGQLGVHIAEPITLEYAGRQWIVAKAQADYAGLGGFPTEEEGELMIVPKEHIIFDL